MKYFLAAADLEHITKAAKQLSIAQPALTQSLHRLEQELGVALFVRQGRNVRLTAEGAWLRDQWRPVVASLDAIETGLHRKAQQEIGTVTLCIGSASVLVVDALAAYKEANPDAQFHVTQDENAQGIDVAVESFGPWEHPKEGSLFIESIGVALPAADPRTSPVPLASLAEDRFIRLAGSRRLSAICDQCCAVHGFTCHPSFVSDNPSVVRKLVGLGLGVGFWPERSWGPLGSGAKLASLAEDNFKRAVGLRLTAEGFEKPAAVAFYQHLHRWFERTWQKRP